MIRNYQERQRLKPPAVPIPQIVTVATVNGQAAQLAFSDGTVSQKYYKSLVAVAVGQKVKIVKQNGTFIILGPV